MSDAAPPPCRPQGYQPEPGERAQGRYSGVPCSVLAILPADTPGDVMVRWPDGAELPCFSSCLSPLGCEPADTVMVGQGTAGP